MKELIVLSERSGIERMHGFEDIEVLPLVLSERSGIERS